MDNTEWRQDIHRLRENIVCKDGFKFSVQASHGHHCTPQELNSTYLSAELGLVSDIEELLMPFAGEEAECECGANKGIVGRDTLYDNVPTNVILEVIVKHGGMVSGELPPLRVDASIKEEDIGKLKLS